jgi:V8-like Glu-specific endopeptidase
MRAGARLRAVIAVAAVTAVAVVSSCSAPVLSPPPGRGAIGYWNRSRLLHARTMRPRYPFVPTPGQSYNAHPALIAPRVGALFVRQGSADHFCTASVVASPGRDLLITAAHCINGGNGSGYRQDIVFIPDYRNGQAPLGVWAVRRLLVAPGWAADANPDLDVGFVILESHDGQNIEDILGANRLAFDPPYQDLVRVTGYPASGDAPITCLNYTSRLSATQLRFVCGGFTGGTSGSPWVMRFDRLTRTGTIVGVIGGYQQGGYTDSVSYSAYLGLAIERLYRTAVADEGPPPRPSRFHLLLSTYVGSRLAVGRPGLGGCGA